ncbi:MAG TPA: ATP-binding protein, partial [Acidimicrobiales bacterium]|nr:ATP-binding protein [Acidimicrobiales bacterium]
RASEDTRGLRRRARTAEAELATVVDRARRLEGALDLVGEGIIVVDLQGRRLFTNAAAGLLTDARHEEALLAAAIDGALEEALEGRTVERQIDLFGPPLRQVSVAASPLGPASDRLGAVVVVRDESRLRRLEAIRQEFVANVSHELKTPIGGIALLAETLAATDDAADLERRIDLLVEDAHRLGRVVDDLLELSEVEGRDRTREPVDLAAVVEDAVRTLQPAADRLGITIELDVAEDQACLGDARQLGSAVTNLIDNALKYTDGRSPVTVSVRPGDGWADVVVRDRGIGIPQPELERVFERFYRVDKARSRDTGGTGLGLAIVRNVARAHGGEVLVTSREGEGSTFTLRLPLVSVPTSDKEARRG